MGLVGAKKNTVFLIDFGLARRYVLASGEARPARDQTGFRGTARYASIHSHLAKDLGRRDDLWSLFYLLVEFALGSLPWRKLKDKDQVGEVKLKIAPQELCRDLPGEFLRIMEHLQSLDYVDKPNYLYLARLMHELFTRLGGDDNTPFDWDVLPVKAAQRPRPLPSLVDLAFLKLAAHLERMPEVRVPLLIKKRMLDFLIRVRVGRVPRALLDRLLDAHLVDLDLSYCELAEADYAHVFGVCTRLKSLTLGSVSDPIVKLVCSACRSLEQLSVYCAKGFSNKALRTIADCCPGLTALKLKCSEKVSDSGLEPVLQHCTRLEELSLFGCKKIKGSALKGLAKLKKKDKAMALRKLNLSYCELSKKGWKYAVRLGADLQALYFSPLAPAFKITAADFLELVHACTGLTALDLSNYSFETDAVLVEVARCCGSLQTLLLDGIGMTDYGLRAVLQSCSRLETLRFRYGDGVTEASLHQITKSATTLRSLTLDFWNKFNRMSVSDQAIRGLLGSCTALHELSLCNCFVLTAASFPELGYFPYLSTLNLSECVQLNDHAVKRVVESCPNLRRLDLNNLNNLTEASLQAIALHCPVLEDLYLISCSCFTDESVKQLLKSMPKLFIQVTRYCDVDLRGILKEVHCTVVDKIFSYYPNTYREKALEKTRKRGI